MLTKNVEWFPAWKKPEENQVRVKILINWWLHGSGPVFDDESWEKYGEGIDMKIESKIQYNNSEGNNNFFWEHSKIPVWANLFS